MLDEDRYREILRGIRRRLTDEIKGDQRKLETYAPIIASIEAQEMNFQMYPAKFRMSDFLPPPHLLNDKEACAEILLVGMLEFSELHIKSAEDVHNIMLYMVDAYKRIAEIVEAESLNEANSSKLTDNQKFERIGATFIDLFIKPPPELDPDEEMPPPEFREDVSEQQRDRLRAMSHDKTFEAVNRYLEKIGRDLDEVDKFQQVAYREVSLAFNQLYVTACPLIEYDDSLLKTGDMDQQMLFNKQVASVDAAVERGMSTTLKSHERQVKHETERKELLEPARGAGLT